MERIAFFSYKGGACRSSTALNTLPFLVKYLNASALKPILVIDADFDSAGMTYLLDADDVFVTGGIVSDIKTLIKNAIPVNSSSNIENNSVLKNTVPVGRLLGVEDGAVRFLGCNTGIILDKSDISGSNARYFELIIKECQKLGFKAVIMDSAAGDQFSAKMCVDAADSLACCMRPTMQFRQGTFSYLARNRNNIDSKKIVLVPTAVPQEDLVINTVSLKKQSCDKIKEGVELTDGYLSDEMLKDGFYGIPEVPRFKWKEEVLYRIKREGAELSAQENAAYKAYEHLAECLCLE